MPSYCIGDLIVDLECPGDLIHDNMSAYIIEEGRSADITIKVQVISKREFFLSDVESVRNSTLLMTTEYCNVYQNDNYYVIRYSCSEGSNIVVKCTKKGCLFDVLCKDSVCVEGLFNAIRDAFFFACSNYDRLLIHSSSVVYNNRCLLFSAPSGTGKTTHTNMWEAEYGTPILDGDINLLYIDDDKVYVYGLPWCGTSNRNMNARYELDTIFFINRAKECEVIEMGMQEIVTNFLARNLNPKWDKCTLKRIILTCNSFWDKLTCKRLDCTLSVASAHVVKAYIDQMSL